MTTTTSYTPSDSQAAVNATSNLRLRSHLIAAEAKRDWLKWADNSGEPQRVWEPPRVIPRGALYRRARLEALGNSMVFWLVYELMAAIKAWCEAQDAQAVEVQE